MRLIQENILANVRLEAHAVSITGSEILNFRVIRRDYTVFRGLCFDKAFRMFDMHVNNALHTQPKEVMPSVDLEEPHESIKTSTGNAAEVVGKVEISGSPYVVLVRNSSSSLILLSNRDGSKLFCANNFTKYDFTLEKMPTQKTGWISIYKGSSSSAQVGMKIMSTRAECIKNSIDEPTDTIQITWEE